MGTIYRYFENKDNLINEIHGTFKAEMHAVIFRDDSDELPVRERFINLFVNMTNYMIKYPNIFRFMEQYYNSPRITSYNVCYTKLLRLWHGIFLTISSAPFICYSSICSIRRSGIPEKIEKFRNNFV